MQNKILSAAVVMVIILIVTIIYFIKPNKEQEAVSFKNKDVAISQEMVTLSEKSYQHSPLDIKEQSKTKQHKTHQKHFSQAERIQALEILINAAEQDISDVRKAIKNSKNAGNVQKTKQLQARLDNMQNMLKSTILNNSDLEVVYPKELLE